MEVRTDHEGWVQEATAADDPQLQAPEDEIRRAAAEGARFTSDTFRALRQHGVPAEGIQPLIKLLATAQSIAATLARLRQAENGATREARMIAHDFLPTPEERAAFMRAAQPSPIVRALPVPKAAR